jgi:hypothetical protein
MDSTFVLCILKFNEMSLCLSSVVRVLIVVFHCADTFNETDGGNFSLDQVCVIKLSSNKIYIPSFISTTYVA